MAHAIFPMGKALGLLPVLPVLLALLALCAQPAMANPQGLLLSGHLFSPDHITVPAGQRFKLLVTSHDSTPDEFESPDLRVEKIIMPGQTITVMAGPLSPGVYKFYDDYHPETANGLVEAK